MEIYSFTPDIFGLLVAHPARDLAPSTLRVTSLWASDDALSAQALRSSSQTHTGPASSKGFALGSFIMGSAFFDNACNTVWCMY
mmetsp:Transcript_150115/g.265430  ORF Transcript_150115/g.265430 Transcript_150115/m.265430 type:complete len:84 (+) Transcript_150115:238-489(+)